MSDTIPSKVKRKPLHDLGDYRGWGNNFSILNADGDGLRLCVFRSQVIRKGDYLAVPDMARDGARVLYRVDTIRTPPDPGDQHFIDATFQRWPKSVSS